MRIRLLVVIAILMMISGCSGFIPSPFSGGGKIVDPELLAQFEGGGSIGTLWYRGSDLDYHYFVHYLKVATEYRVPREKLIWENEYSIGEKRKPTLVNDEISTYVKSNS